MVRIFHNHHYIQPFTIHCWIKASPILFHSCLSSAICIHLTPPILLNSSAHLPLGLHCFLSHSLGYHSSISRVHLPSILLVMCLLQLFHTFRYIYICICHFDHTSHPCIPLTISSRYTKHTSFNASLCVLDLMYHS
jgi:hypothetical protein